MRERERERSKKMNAECWLKVSKTQLLGSIIVVGHEKIDKSLLTAVKTINGKFKCFSMAPAIVLNYLLPKSKPSRVLSGC